MHKATTSTGSPVQKPFVAEDQIGNIRVMWNQLRDTFKESDMVQADKLIDEFQRDHPRLWNAAKKRVYDTCTVARKVRSLQGWATRVKNISTGASARKDIEEYGQSVKAAIDKLTLDSKRMLEKGRVYDEGLGGLNVDAPRNLAKRIARQQTADVENELVP